MPISSITDSMNANPYGTATTNIVRPYDLSMEHGYPIEPNTLDIDGNNLIIVSDPEIRNKSDNKILPYDGPILPSYEGELYYNDYPLQQKDFTLRDNNNSLYDRKCYSSNDVLNHPGTVTPLDLNKEPFIGESYQIENWLTKFFDTIYSLFEKLTKNNKLFLAGGIIIIGILIHSNWIPKMI